MSKFKNGDLVTLSAAGRKNQHNENVYGLIGIVWNIRRHTYPIEIKWFGFNENPQGLFPMKEYEIKFVKQGAEVL